VTARLPLPFPSTATTTQALPVLHGVGFLFVTAAALTALAPVPVLVQAWGAPQATAVLATLAGTAALVEIMGARACGARLDVVGRRPALVGTLSAVAVVHGLVACQPTSVTRLLLAKFTVLLGISLYTLASQACLSDLCLAAAAAAPHLHRDTLVSSAVGVSLAVTGLGFLVGVLGAGLLQGLGGLPLVYGSSTVLAAVAALMTRTCLPETLVLPAVTTPAWHTRRRSTTPAATCQPRPSTWQSLREAPLAAAALLTRHGPQVRRLAVLLLLMTLPQFQGDFFQIYATTEWGLSTQAFSSYLALYATLSIVANGLGSRVVIPRLGIKRFTCVAICSRAFTSLGTILFGFQGSVVGLVVGCLGLAQAIGIYAALVAAGAASGLPQGQLAGERASLLALLKVVGPVWYSTLYIQGSRRLGVTQLPFFCNLALSVAALVLAARHLPDPAPGP
jgi:MFS family permease